MARTVALRRADEIGPAAIIRPSAWTATAADVGLAASDGITGAITTRSAPVASRSPALRIQKGVLRRLPSDAALLAIALAAIALVIGATLLLHHVFVGDGDGVRAGTTAVRTAVGVSR